MHILVDQPFLVVSVSAETHSPMPADTLSKHAQEAADELGAEPG